MSTRLAKLWEKFQKDVWGWTVFVLAFAGYLPVIYGSWLKPEENNIAAWALWSILAALFTYSLKDKGFSGWRLPFAFIAGNIAMLIVAWIKGGYWELGTAEIIALFGSVSSVFVWGIYFIRTGRSESRILFYGCLIADIICFYPMGKQWYEAKETVSLWTLLGWETFLIAVIINCYKVEKLIDNIRLRSPNKSLYMVIEPSIFSLEQMMYISIMMYLMTLPK